MSQLPPTQPTCLSPSASTVASFPPGGWRGLGLPPRETNPRPVPVLWSPAPSTSGVHAADHPLFLPSLLEHSHPHLNKLSPSSPKNKQTSAPHLPPFHISLRDPASSIPQNCPLCFAFSPPDFSNPCNLASSPSSLQKQLPWTSTPVTLLPNLVASSLSSIVLTLQPLCVRSQLLPLRTALLGASTPSSWTPSHLPHCLGLGPLQPPAVPWDLPQPPFPIDLHSFLLSVGILLYAQDPRVSRAQASV